MPSTITTISAEELEAVKSELRAEFRGLLQAYVVDNDRWLRTDEALETAEICRATLVMSARADAPNTEQPGRITYRKVGTTCWYKQSSCITYALAKKGLPTLIAA